MSAPHSTTSALPIPPNIGAIAGPLVNDLNKLLSELTNRLKLIGYLLHWGLFGVLSTQVYVYHLAFPEDPLRTQALVYGVYLVEFVQTMLFTVTAFNTFAKGFGSMMAIIDGSLLWFSVPIMSSVVTFIVQVFYAYRIYKVGKAKAIAGAVILLACGQLGGGVATGVIAHQIRDFTNFLVVKTLIATGVWNGCSALCDVVIAGAMTYYLQKHNSRRSSTRRIVQRIIRLVIETGTLTAVLAIVNLALSVLPGQPTYFQTTSAVLGKMYSNTMMVVFNSRMRIGRLQESEGYNSSSAIASADLHEHFTRSPRYVEQIVALEPQRRNIIKASSRKETGEF
ncbi:hypothetical protein CPB83DRAFT_467878 [Crepidotus variabilis]|uniref:DUF6534 domain-containing protein n=1 Tax=Crepidotus variabilis TaxID=179855 RepID=A0A9P6ECJ3_9AGAR|nr:hypothetical protein CPB83DRAFT_467878 [Crepidotus variabilis]